MIAKDKLAEIFCVIDEFDNKLNENLAKNMLLPRMTAKANVTETARADCPKARL